MKTLLAAVTVLAVSTTRADTIYVDSSCPGPGNGSEAEPYCSIQTAIDNAVNSDDVVVAPGTYFEAINFIGKAITLRSSAGANATTINGSGFPHVVQCVSGEGPDTVLDGFWITGGNANSPFPGNLGGGMYIAFSLPTVINCSFIGNSADLGGGLATNDSSPTVRHCTFQANSADQGGGLFTVLGNPSITDCIIRNNSALFGGGIWTDSSDIVVTDCMFEDNNAFLGGGGMHVIGGLPVVRGCTFRRNGTSLASGGGIRIEQTDTTVTHCKFEHCTAAVEGGGISIFGGSRVTLVSNCSFSGNSAGERGGGMENGGGGLQVVTNCTFTDNSSGMPGGGTYNSDGNPTFSNCIFWANQPDQIFPDGDGEVAYSNVQDGWPGTGNIDADPMFVDPDNGDFSLQPGSPCIDAADNTAVQEDVTTDLDGNPRFLDVPETPDTGNGTLPIVDMGAYESLGGGCLAVTSQQIVCHADGTSFTVTIEGLNACTGGTTQVTFTASGGSVGQELCFTALVNDGGFCCSTEICVMIPDCTPAALPSDLDGDGTVGMTDFLALLGAWGPCSDCGTCPADFDGDCSVGILDLLTLLGNWE
ncbi:MAG: hypothetical protein E2O40_03610 [Planctomycetota bacterium]|nr:MAG: hypothetical protein E2O40_03610 [Planctomycetota bacterium]